MNVEKLLAALQKLPGDAMVAIVFDDYEVGNDESTNILETSFQIKLVNGIAGNVLCHLGYSNANGTVIDA